MLPTSCNYAIYPSVVQANVPSDMIILPTERAFLMQDGAEYRLGILSLNDDETNYYAPSTKRYVTATASGGVLRFQYTFPDEQQHLIILERDEVKLQEFSVYSLYEDLYSLRPLKGDLHSHSYRSDGQRDPAALAGHYREQGYEFFALTDHNRFFPGGEIDETYADVKCGIMRVRGEEVHAPGSTVHIVHVGGKQSVTERYVHQRKAFEQEVADYLQRVPAHVPEQYRDRYAKAMWATDCIHEAGGLAIFPHPFWRPAKSRVYNMPEELARLLLLSGMFDAYEVVGCMGQIENNRSVALWSDLRAEGLRIPVVGSSDVHSLEKSGSFGSLFTLCFAKANDNDSIIQAVRSGMSVAVEAIGEEPSRQRRCYGSLRLGTYAHFLLEQYYPQLQRICQGEGVALRAYAMGWADKALIEGQAQQAEQFRRWFFGLAEPLLPTGELLAFEDKWRAVQLNGPLTKGSGLDAPPVTRQI